MYRCDCGCYYCCDEDEGPPVSRKMRKIINSHWRGVGISKDDCDQEGENEWSVLSSDGQRRYLIEKTDEDESCLGFYEPKCESCGICIHSFTCSCPDNVENNNICKHIHACYIHFFKDASVKTEPSSESESSFTDGFMSSAPCSSDSKRGLIKSKLEVIVGLENKFSLSLADENRISKYLDEVIDIYNVNGQVKDTVTATPKIEPQIRVISTKRKPQEDTHEPLYETKIIKLEELAHPKAEVANISTDFNFDHSYSRLRKILLSLCCSHNKE